MCDFYFAGFISKLFKGYLREACFPPSSYARCLLFLKASSPVKLLHWTLLHQPPSNPLSHIYSRCSPISLAFVRALHSHKSATARWIIYHPSLVLLLSSRCHYNYYAFYTRGFKAKREKKTKRKKGAIGLYVYTTCHFEWENSAGVPETTPGYFECFSLWNFFALVPQFRCTGKIGQRSSDSNARLPLWFGKYILVPSCGAEATWKEKLPHSLSSYQVTE